MALAIAVFLFFILLASSFVTGRQVSWSPLGFVEARPIGEYVKYGDFIAIRTNPQTQSGFIVYMGATNGGIGPVNTSLDGVPRTKVQDDEIFIIEKVVEKAMYRNDARP